MYSTRILPSNEWYKLDSRYIPHEVFDEDTTNIMVVERDGVIVGSWSLMPFYHAECVWISENHKNNPAIARRLLIGMERMAKELGVEAVITTAASDRVSKILKKLKNAEKLPGENYLIRFGR